MSGNVLSALFAVSFLTAAPGGQTAKCSKTYKNYTVGYYIDGCTDRATFDVTHDLTSTIRLSNEANEIWTGLGIGRAHFMADLDFIQLNVNRATAQVMIYDTRVKGLITPTLDDSQDVSLDSFSLDGNILRARFSREITTGDVIGDVDLNDRHDLALTHVGGTLSSTRKMLQHAGTPREFHRVHVTHCRRTCDEVNARPSLTIGACLGLVNTNSWCDSHFRLAYGTEGCAKFRQAFQDDCLLTACQCFEAMKANTEHGFETSTVTQ